MARKSKYNADTFPLLAEGYARRGLSVEQIAHNLGISNKTFYEYQIKYSEFSQAIKRGKMPVDMQVENAMLKRCLGFEYEEVHTLKKIVDKKETIEIKKIKKYIPADPALCIFWSKNRQPDRWSNNPEEDKKIENADKSITPEMTAEDASRMYSEALKND